MNVSVESVFILLVSSGQVGVFTTNVYSCNIRLNTIIEYKNVVSISVLFSPPRFYTYWCRVSKLIST